MVMKDIPFEHQTLPCTATGLYQLYCVFCVFFLSPSPTFVTGVLDYASFSASSGLSHISFSPLQTLVSAVRRKFECSAEVVFLQGMTSNFSDDDILFMTS